MTALWTPEARIRALEMVRRGLPYGEIGERFGVTRHAISGLVFRQNHPDERVRRRKYKPQIDLIARRKPVAIAPSKAPFEPDDSCPDFAWDDAHLSAVAAARPWGFPVAPINYRSPAA